MLFELNNTTLFSSTEKSNICKSLLLEVWVKMLEKL